MSQMVTRKGPVGEDKEKVQADTPVKEMKKKMAANAEKEKQAAEKDKTVEKLPEKAKPADKQPEKVKPAEKQPEKAKPAEKQPEKAKPAEKQHPEKAKPADKQQPEKAKPAEKQPEKVKPAEKQPEKTKPAEKQPEKVKPTEKQAEKEKERGEKTVEKKNDAPAEKPKEDNIKPDKLDDKEKDKPKRSHTDTPTPQKSSKQNGARPNGIPENGCGGEHSDATVSSDDERDDMFPELAYDDSDGEFEPPTPEGLPSRSYTRRSQAKATRTPETPRPASDRRADRADRDADDSKESKVLKLKDDGMATDRKLRSSDSPKPESRKPGEKEKEASPRKKDLEVSEREGDKDKSTVEIVIDLDGDDEPAEGPAEERARGKADTNYSRSRVKVSPYRRGGRVAPAAPADVTATSLLANYTGNNTTMEMDITETSSLVGGEEAGSEAMDGSPYLSAIRNMRGRRSYRPLREMALRGVCGGRGARSPAALPVPVTEHPSRPTAPVVGRKRKPEGDTSAELGSEAHDAEEAARGKRARLLEKLARPFRTVATASLPIRRNAEIVGINTDLPLTAPVAAPETFDPETLKTSAPNVVVTPPSPIPTPEHEREGKRCSIM